MTIKIKYDKVKENERMNFEKISFWLNVVFCILCVVIACWKFCEGCVTHDAMLTSLGVFYLVLGLDAKREIEKFEKDIDNK